MTTPRRFTPFEPLSREGSLLAAGRAEMPEALALRRVARHIGVSAAVLGVASTTCVASTTSTVSAATVTGASGTAPAALSAPFFSLTFVKAIVVGVGIGASTLGAVELVREQAPATMNRPSNAAVVNKKVAAAAAASLSHAPVLEETKVEQLAEMAAVPVQPAKLAIPTSDSVRVAPVLPTTRTAVGSEQLHAASAPTAEVLPSLAREVASLDRARAAVSRGDASMAIRELDEFARSGSYRALSHEAMLVRIEALLVMGYHDQAAVVARQLLQLGAPAMQRARLEKLSRTQP